MKIIVCGSRRPTNPFAVSLHIYQRLAELPDGSVIVHGAAHGVDRMAADAGAALGYRLKAYPADWETEGRQAGLMRNLRMLDENPDLVIAWWDGASRGTHHTIREAERRGIPVEVHKI